MSGEMDPGSPGENDLPEDEEFELPEEDAEGDDGQPPEAPEEELEPPLPPQRQSRRERQADNWRDRAIRAEAERDAMRNYQPQPQAPPRQDPQLQQQQRQQDYQRISMLPPEEQVAAMDQLMQRHVALARLEAFDLNDRSNFELLKTSYPAAQRLAPQVERILQQQRDQGVYNFSREQIYHFLLGQEVHNRASQGAQRQRVAGERRVARQTTRPANGRGDVATGSNRTRGDDADRRLLEGTMIRDL